MRVWRGAPYPLGATWDGAGVNFALFSEHATGVQLCLFDSPDATMERICIPLTERTDYIWHAYLPDIVPGQIYGYRVAGPWAPGRGHRFSPAKVLLDPYAKVIGRDIRWSPSLFAYAPGTEGEGPMDAADSAAAAALAAVCDPACDWASDRPPLRPWQDTVIYELHVKGFTQLNPHIPAPLRGTYLGVASEPAIAHLKKLGITAVELMPVHQHADEWALVRRGLTNYWGYNTLSYFAPSLRFAPRGTSLDAALEFKIMVRALHEAGIEVLLDVVYNHTAENDHLGPSLSMRGIDNKSYYRLRPGDPSRYEDFTGTGNTLNMHTPYVLKLVMDSLRYWVLEMHVDGFRFDLASALARGRYSVDQLSAFFDVIAQDPVISQVKLIAEPWDVGENGYQVGQFPPGWTEWNGRYRDAVRQFWRGDAGMLPELATRLGGSSDLYSLSGRRPHASVNFVTSHDGFTLADLTAFEQKHNEANGEGNRDGESQNFSWNAGVEGPTDDPAILEIRRRQRRNFVLTLAISQGVPMLSGGDEMGRTQRGNNNAYCQDSELTWTPWDIPPEEHQFLSFVRRAFALRRDQPVLRRRTFLSGRAGAQAVYWLRADGREMTDSDWQDDDRRTLGVLLDGDAIGETNDRSEIVAGESLLILLNASADAVAFTLPPSPAAPWVRAIDTAEPDASGDAVPPDVQWTAPGRSAVVFVRARRA